MFDLYDLSNPQLYTDSKEIAPKERKNLSSIETCSNIFAFMLNRATGSNQVSFTD